VSIRFLADARSGLRNRSRRSASRAVNRFQERERCRARRLPDDKVLEIAAREDRVLVSHDKRTMPVHFAARIRSGLRNPGVLLALPRATVGEIVEALITIWASSREEDWVDQIHYLPSLSQHLFR